MTLAEVHVKWSVILMDLLGANIFSTLGMKGQVLHRGRAHLKVPGWSLVWNELLTKKLPMFLSRLNEISGGWEKIVPISEPFWSNLIFLRMIDLTAWLWGGNVRVNGMRSPFPTNWSQSALQTAEKENTDHILFNHAVKSIRWPIYVFNSVFNVKYLLEAVRLQVNEKIDEKTHY